jgi:hypothetical protein
METSEIEKIADHYKSSPTFRLVRLAENPAGLPDELVPVLQKELLTRGEQDATLKLTEYLVQRNTEIIQRQREEEQYKEETKPLTPEEARTEIMERLKGGESMDSIALKLKARGIDVFNELDREMILQENAFDYIASLREKGLADDALDQQLIKDLSLDQVEVDILKEKMRKHGSANITIGLVTTSVTLVLMLWAGRFPILGVMLLGIGVWRIVEGQRILSKSR